MRSVVSVRSLISIESSDGGGAAELSAREAEALQTTVACISACHIGELFADSKFLQVSINTERLAALCGQLERYAWWVLACHHKIVQI